MEIIQKRSKFLNIAALLLIIPAAYLIFVSALKYGLHVNGPFDASEPTLEWLGINENLGWNINLFILFGPVIAFFIAAWQVIHIDWKFSREDLKFQVTILKKRFPLFIIFLGSLVLATLFVYLIGENLIIR